MQPLSAQIGAWYKDLQSGSVFEVVAVDDAAQTIEVQLLEGELCEYDRDSWRQMLLQEVEEPEDWRHAFDQDDDGDADRPRHLDNWDNPLDLIEPEIDDGSDDDDF
jgi:hypothetical protein